MTDLNALKRQVPITCKHCGKVTMRQRHAIYCSNTCKYNWVSANRRRRIKEGTDKPVLTRKIDQHEDGGIYLFIELDRQTHIASIYPNFDTCIADKIFLTAIGGRLSKFAENRIIPFATEIFNKRGFKVA